MFFRKQDDLSQEVELAKMRSDLVEYYADSFRGTCIQQLKSFTEFASTNLMSETHFDESHSERTQANVDQALQLTLRQIENINKMSDGDVKQLYYQAFHRWHPLR